MKSLKLLFGLAVLPAFAHADDGILFYSGPPELLKGGAEIRMVREFVQAKVGRHASKVYCRFVFRNGGAATTIRIGFPDGSDHDQEEGSDPKPSLKHFRSDVDGKPVQLRIERAEPDNEYAFYHVKTVKFAAHQTRVIEDWYDQPLDEQMTNSGGYLRTFSYTMASGASWKGLIGQAVVQVVFMDPMLTHPAPYEPEFYGEDFDRHNLRRMRRNRVLWNGFAKPKVVKHGLIFRRRNFKPDSDSDVHVTFAPITKDP